MTLFSKNKFYTQFEIVLDGCLLAFSFFISYALRNFLSTVLPLPPLQEFIWYSWVFFFLVLVWPIVMYMNGKYVMHIARSFQKRLLATFKAAVYSLLSFLFVLFIFKLYYINRSFLMLFVSTGFLAIVAKDALFDYYLQYKHTPQVIIVGRLASCVPLCKDITAQIDIKGIVVSKDDVSGDKAQGGLKILGPVSKFRTILHHVPPDAVFLNLEKSFLEEANEVVRICEEEGIEVWAVSDMLHMTIAQMELVKLGPYNMLVFTPAVHNKPWQLFFKRIFDIAVSYALLLLGAPLFLLIACAIKLDSPGPVFFIQKRLGEKGRKFLVYKFRSMVSDAEQRKSELKKLNIMKGPAFKVINDPRVTRIGRILRRWSLDELPQLWNVANGTMSLVGPRPTPVAESMRYKGWQRKRFSMKPGLTCLWQIRGRNEITDLNEWMNLDLEYINNWSLWLDFKILCKTIPIVLSSKGAW